MDGLLLGQLEVTAGLVVTEGDGAAHHGDLHQTTGHLGDVLGLHRIVRGREVHGLVDESLTAGAGANGLVVDLGATSLRQVSEPALIDLGGEGCASSTEAVCGRGGHAGADGQQGADQKGLLREGHG